MKFNFKEYIIKTNNIVKKLKVLTLLPLVVIFIYLLFFIFNSYNTLLRFHTLQDDIVKIKQTAALIDELQKERGISSGYIGSNAKEFAVELQQQKVRTNKAFERFIQISHIDTNLYLQQQKQLDIQREKIQTLQISNIDSFNYYTKLIAQLQKYYLETTLYVEDTKMKNYLQVYTNIAIMKESLGQIRGAFNGIFSLEYMEKQLFYKAAHAQGMFDSAHHRFEAIASHKILQKFAIITQSKEYKWIHKTIQKYSTQEVRKTTLNPITWWKQATYVLNQFYSFEKNYFSQIDEYILYKSHHLMMELTLNFTILVFITVFISWLGYKIKNDIMRNISLLNEYKNAVDRSSIVSKTNKRGIITYVNEQFCKISGYTQNELLGKSHNIVRHPDMPKEAFRNMWQTILSKQPWSGIVKNKKKDGGAYIVEATINPILNHDGEIEEFIAIRNDITEVIKLHEELKNTQKDLIYRMSELTETRSKETGFHVRRVAKYSELLAKYSQLNPEEIKNLTLASPMHDIGKVGIPDHILHKPTKLTPDEWEVMKSHTTIGYNLFQDSDKPLLKAAAIIAHQHHEKYDGSGYPQGLKGDEIHIYARITALADTFDALNSKRSYKEAWSDEDIFNYIKQESGKHFDPKLITIFFEHLDEFLEIRKHYKDASAFMKES